MTIQIIPTGAQVRISSHATTSSGTLHKHAGQLGVIDARDKGRYSVRLLKDSAIVRMRRRNLAVVEEQSSVEPLGPDFTAATAQLHEPANHFTRARSRQHQDALLAIASGGRLANARMTTVYDGAELRRDTRPGAHDHARHPSRIGDLRVWRDGRTEEVT